jgi:hypothetical protein
MTTDRFFITMKLTPVKSSNLAAIGYEPKLKSLTVQFHNGAAWEYFGVPASVWEGLRSAKSHGQYFHQNIRSDFKSNQLS